jgi:hypothetical protein
VSPEEPRYLLDGDVFLEWHAGECCASCLDDPPLNAEQGECCCVALRDPYPDGPRPFRYLLAESAPAVHEREYVTA